MVRPVPQHLHIIEPTLRSHDGHLSSLVREFAELFDGPVIVHADRNVQELSMHGVEIVGRFPRRLRKLMLPWVYFRLLRTDERVLVSTATTADFWSLGLASRLSRRSTSGVTLFVHWYRHKRRKGRVMSAFAREHPDIAVLAPTPECTDALRSCGFRNVTQVPYPFHFQSSQTDTVTADDPIVLVAGGTRRDKGFRHVVALIEHLASRGVDLPFTIQVSGDHWGEYKDNIGSLVERLHEVRLPRLRTVSDALGPGAYQALFRGTIVLQPYESSIFRDRVSGVTLDALNAGSPIVASAGTWTSGIVARFGCGVVCESSAPESLHEAIQTIRSRYPEFQGRTLAARAILRHELEASPVARILRRDIGPRDS
jgi:glycosyltransferase involved in cell wall biosynthesis